MARVDSSHPGGCKDMTSVAEIKIIGLPIIRFAALQKRSKQVKPLPCPCKNSPLELVLPFLLNSHEWPVTGSQLLKVSFSDMWTSMIQIPHDQQRLLDL